MPESLVRKTYSAKELVTQLLVDSRAREVANSRLASSRWQTFDLSITVYSEHVPGCFEFDTDGKRLGVPAASFRFPLLVWPHGDENAAASIETPGEIDFNHASLRDVDRVRIDFQWSRSTNQQFLRIVGVPVLLKDA